MLADLMSTAGLAAPGLSSPAPQPNVHSGTPAFYGCRTDHSDPATLPADLSASGARTAASEERSSPDCTAQGWWATFRANVQVSPVFTGPSGESSTNFGASTSTVPAPVGVTVAVRSKPLPAGLVTTIRAPSVPTQNPGVDSIDDARAMAISAAVSPESARCDPVAPLGIERASVVDSESRPHRLVQKGARHGQEAPTPHLLRRH